MLLCNVLHAVCNGFFVFAFLTARLVSIGHIIRVCVLARTSLCVSFACCKCTIRNLSNEIDTLYADVFYISVHCFIMMILICWIDWMVPWFKYLFPFWGLLKIVFFCLRFTSWKWFWKQWSRSRFKLNTYFHAYWIAAMVCLYKITNFWMRMNVVSVNWYCDIWIKLSVTKTE